MTSLKERRWEIMEVGEEFGPIDVTVDTGLVRAFAYSVDDFTAEHVLPRHDGVHKGHPALLCREARDVISTVYDISSGGAGMHVKHECYFHGCPEVGKTYRITGRHTEKFIKREKQYIVLESDVHDPDGNLLFQQRSTHIRALKPGVAKSASTATETERPAPVSEPVAQDRNDIAAGSLLRPLTKTFEQEHLTVFAGTSWKNIHNDTEVARKAGLSGTIASGLQTMAGVCELMEGYFQDGWTKAGHLAVAFTAPLLVGVPVTVGARITEITPERATAEVWADTGAGLRVLAGTASASV